MHDREATERAIALLRQFAAHTAQENQENLRTVYPALRLLNHWAFKIQVAMRKRNARKRK